MFEGYILNMKKLEKDLIPNWKRVFSSDSVYTLAKYGFYSWCAEAGTKTEKYRKAEGLSRTGTNGQMFHM